MTVTDAMFFGGIFAIGLASGFFLAALCSVVADDDSERFERLAKLCMQHAILSCPDCHGSGIEQWVGSGPERCSSCKHMQSTVFREVERIRSAA